jgi:aspartyl-tRNA(Asn)/glutamyl-tRNA(Gln) amidotransferase subunit B
VDLFRVMKESGKGIAELPVSPQALVELIGLVEAGTVNLNTGREVLDEMAATGKSARQIVEEKGLAQISDEAALRAVVERVLDENPTQVAQYLAGKEQVAGWLMGQVMRATGGKANPQMVRGLLVDALEKRR